MALQEEAWLAALPADLREPALSVLNQLSSVANLVAESLSRTSAADTIRAMEGARPRLRQIVQDAGKHVNVEEMGELVARRMSDQHGEVKAQETMQTFAALLADRPGEVPVR